MKEIPLTQGKVALVDDDDYLALSVYRWYAHWDRWNFYAVRKESQTRKTIYMHKVVCSSNLVDHSNGNTLDNRRGNLRPVTPGANSRNVRVRTTPGKSSKYKGVYWRKDTGKWVSQIKVNGRTINLGSFENEMDAALSYDGAARLHFGQYARPNF